MPLLRGQRYTAPSLLRPSLAMLDCLEAPHDRGFVRRYVKPGTFPIALIRRTRLRDPG
jgi:hypothetical protein